MKITPVSLDQKQKDTWSGRTKLRIIKEEKHKTGCFVLKTAIGCRNKNKNAFFVLFRLESATYSGEIPKEGEGNTKRRGKPKVKEANGGA